MLQHSIITVIILTYINIYYIIFDTAEALSFRAAGLGPYYYCYYCYYYYYHHHYYYYYYYYYFCYYYYYYYY